MLLPLVLSSNQIVTCCQPISKGLWTAPNRLISASVGPALPRLRHRAVQCAVAAKPPSSAETGMDVAELSVTAELLQRSESTDAQQAEAAAGDAESLSKVGGVSSGDKETGPHPLVELTQPHAGLFCSNPGCRS